MPSEDFSLYSAIINRSDSTIDARIDSTIELTSLRRHSMIFGGFDSLLLICLLLFVEPHLSGFAAESAQRIRPPEKVTCSRVHLTSYTSKVLSMKRQRGSTRIRIRTDEETSEQFTLRHATDNPAEYFLMWGERFSESDWKRIEAGKNQLRPDLRATVWVCDNSRNPVVDWQPAKD